MKPVSKAATTLAVKLRKEGLKQKQIGVEMAKSGFKKENGTPYDQSDVSRILIRSGYRTLPSLKERRKIKRDARKQIVKKMVGGHEETNLVHDLTDLLSSNLSDQMKEKILRSWVVR